MPPPARNTPATTGDSPPLLRDGVLPERKSGTSREADGKPPYREADPPLITREEFGGTDREFESLNRGISRAWKVKNPLVRIATVIRCKLLQLTPTQYSDLLGVPRGTLMHFEQSRSSGDCRLDPTTVSALLRGWLRAGASLPAPQRDMLSEAAGDFLRAATARFGDSVFALFTRWRYEAGAEYFDRQTGLCRKSLWARHSAGYLQDFSEILAVARKLDIFNSALSPAEIRSLPAIKAAEAVWLKSCTTRGREVEVSRLHLLLAYAGIERNTTSLASDPRIGISQKANQQLYQFSPPAWKDASKIYSFLRSEGLISASLASCRTRWEKALARVTAPVADQLRDLRDAQQLDNRDLADGLGISKRQVKKPAMPVYQVLERGESNHHASFATLIYLLARNADERETLLQARRVEIATELVRRGSNTGTPVQLERLLFGVGRKETGLTAKELEKLQNTRAESDPERVAEVVAQIRKTGEAKIAPALRRWIERHDFSSFEGVARRYRDSIHLTPFADKVGSSPRRIISIANSAEIPALHEVRSMLARIDAKPSVPMLLNWQQSLATHLIRSGCGDLERAFKATIALSGETAKKLFERNVGRYLEGGKFLDWLGDTGTLLPRHFTYLLKACGAKPGSIQETYLTAIYHGGSIRHGIVAVEERLARNDPQDTQAVSGLQTLRTEITRAAGTTQKLATMKHASQLFQYKEDYCGLSALNLHQRGSVKTEHGMRLLPGATHHEVLDTQAPSVSGRAALAASLWERLRTRGFLPDQVTFLTSDIEHQPRRPRSLMVSACIRQEPCSILSLGALATIAAASHEELTQTLAKAREVCERDCVSLGVAPTPLSLDLMVWGISHDSLPHPQKSVVAALAKTRPLPDTHPVVRSVQKSIHERQGAIHSRAQQLNGAFLPDQVTRILVSVVPGGAIDLSARAGLSYGAPSKIFNQKFMPDLATYRRMVALSSLPFLDQWEIGWHLGYPATTSRVGQRPLARAIQTTLAAWVARGEPPTSSPDSTLLRHAHQFASDTGIPVRQVMRLVRRAQQGKQIDQGAMDDFIGVTCADGDGPRGEFLRRLNDGHQTAQAIEEVCERFSGRRGIADKFDQLGQLLAYYENAAGRRFPDVRMQDCLTAARWFSGVLFFETKILRSNADENFMQGAAGSSPAIGDTDTKNADPSVNLNGPSESLSSYQRLSIAAERVSRNLTVSSADLLSIIPGQHHRALSDCLAALGQAAPIYISSLAYFADPFDGLERMAGFILEGRQPKLQPLEHFRSLQKFYQDRRGLPRPHLNSGTLGMYFIAPRV